MIRETLYERVCRLMAENAKRDVKAWDKLPCRHVPWFMLIDGWEVPDV